MFPHGDLHPADEVFDFARLFRRMLLRHVLEAVQTVRKDFVVKGIGWTELLETGVVKRWSFLNLTPVGP